MSHRWIRKGAIGALRAMALIAVMVPGIVQSAPEKSDVRVLIDISGSMRQNDPNNLRQPALRMLAGLMQPGTHAGVWTFARWVNNLVPVAEVDAEWKKKTQSLSSQIGSPGQFTNIEEVLDRASRDWSGEPTTHARHLVLLTDGMVDVSKDAAENAASRQRILDTLLPRLRAAGVKVHTMALSERADHELMKRLAGETGGWYQQVNSADELQRTFLKMFETVGKPDAIPLLDNRFTVDGSIDEATVLVFSKPGAEPVVLLSPSGEKFTDSHLPAGVAWYRDQGYDMITIDKPQKGEWSLDADVDPDNRVMIVTDLKLRISEVPTHLAVGEQVHLEAYLSNRGKLVDRRAFLRLLEVRADAVTGEGTEALALNDAGQAGDGAAEDGRYGVQFAERQPRESVELVFAVDSPTFMREKRFRLAVHELVSAAIDAEGQAARLTVDSAVAVLQPGATVEAWQEDASGQRLPLDLQEVAEGRWQATLADPAGPAYARVTGSSRLGNLLDRTVGPIMPPGMQPPPVAVVPEPVAEPEPAPAAAPEPEPPVAPAEVADVAPAEAVVAEAAPVESPADESTAPGEPVEEQESWVLPVAVFGGFNMLLLLGGGAWWFLRRRRARSADDNDELDLDELVGGGDEQAGSDQKKSHEEAA